MTGARVRAYLAVLGLGALLQGCTNAVFAPSREYTVGPQAYHPQGRVLRLTSEDGVSLVAWWLPGSAPTKATIVFAHGNAGNLSGHSANVAWLTDHGYDVLALDYRGYGGSGGRVSVAGAIADVRTALRAATAQTPATRPLILLGQSLGGTLALYAGATIELDRSIDVVVSISAFSDYRRIVRDVAGQSLLLAPLGWPASWLFSNRYRPLDVIGDLAPVPLVIMHGRGDEIVPFHHATALYHRAQQPKTLIEIEGSHNAALALAQNRRRLLDALDSGLESRVAGSTR